MLTNRSSVGLPHQEYDYNVLKVGGRIKSIDTDTNVNLFMQWGIHHDTNTFKQFLGAAAVVDGQQRRLVGAGQARDC